MAQGHYGCQRLFRQHAQSQPRWRGVTRDDSVADCAAYSIEDAADMINAYRNNAPYVVQPDSLARQWAADFGDFEHNPTAPGLWIRFAPGTEPVQVWPKPN